MNPTLQRLMSKATQLAQSGKLSAAAASSPLFSGGNTPLPPMPSMPLNNPEQLMQAHAATFQNFLAKAGSMGQGANVQAATAAIQAALAKASLASGASGTAGAANGSGGSGGFGGFGAFRGNAGVIDVEAWEVGRTARAPQAPAQPAPTIKPGPTGQFVSASHSEASAGTREYKLYIPPESFTEPLPLVLMLHGCTQNPDDFAAGTKMNDAALERGFYVLYPAQTQHANSSRCWNPPVSD
jgi:hypothetical protein